MAQGRLDVEDVPVLFLTGAKSIPTEPRPVESPASVADEEFVLHVWDPAIRGFREPQMVTLAKIADELCAEFATASKVFDASVDTETDIQADEAGKPPVRVAAVAIEQPDGSMRAWVLDKRDVPTSVLARIFKAAKASGWNVEFDESQLLKDGVVLEEWFDAMIADAGLNAGAAGFGKDPSNKTKDGSKASSGDEFAGAYHALQLAARRYLGIEMTGKGDVQTSYDLTSDLSVDQVLYAARDTMTTVWVSQYLWTEAEKAELSQVIEIDQAYRPYVAAMNRNGLPVRFDEYIESLSSTEEEIHQAIARLAELTDGGEINAETGLLEPGWNPNSTPQLKEALNTYATEEVRRYTCEQKRHASDAQHVDEDAPGYCSGGRPLGKDDSTDKKVLQFIGGPLCEAVLLLRKGSKVTGTNGEGMRKHVRTVNGKQRLFGTYKQCLTSTGRLASERPNMQNLSPAMKPFIEAEDGWVFIYGDLSQAEVRGIAHMAGEQIMIDRFKAGGDFHEATAAMMFRVPFINEAMSLAETDYEAFKAKIAKLDPSGALSEMLPGENAPEAVRKESLGMIREGLEALEAVTFMKVCKEDDPHLYKKRRSGAKSTTFGLPYGIAAQALATQLTVQGVPTTKQEAQALLDAYYAAHPKIAAWLGARDNFIKGLSENPPAVDWALSFQLYELRIKTEHLYKAFKKEHKYYASGRELAEIMTPVEELRELIATETERSVDEVSDEEVEARYTRRAGLLDRVYMTDAPVVMLAEKDESGRDKPLSFESRTIAGRRRLFQVLMDSTQNDKFAGVITSAAFAICMTDQPAGIVFKDAFAKENELAIPEGPWRKWKKADGTSMRWTEARVALTKVFEGSNKHFKYELVKAAASHYGWEVIERSVLRRALSDQIRSLGNAYRNHPIQGLVSDAMAVASARIWKQLREVCPEAEPVMSVHDMNLIHCPEQYALEVGRLQKREMERALREFCPTVPVIADVEVCKNLGDSGHLYEITLEEGPAELESAPAA